MNLICGSMWGYDWNAVRVWAHSLKRANIDAEKIVFLRDTNPEVAEKLRNVGISSQVWTIRNTRLHPITTRWEPIIGHLSSNSYDSVVCTDIKDCVFQADPFPFIAASPRPIVLATESIPCNDPIWHQENYKWMKEYLGNQAGPMANKEVVCGGTITGRQPELLSILKTMYDILAAHKNPRLIDQCVLNHLAHTRFRDQVYIPRLKEGFILSGNFCWQSKMDPPPDVRKGVAYPRGGSKPFALYHLYFPKNRDAITTRYWHPVWDGTCHQCGSNNWGKQGFYGRPCLSCGNRYSYRGN